MSFQDSPNLEGKTKRSLSPNRLPALTPSTAQPTTWRRSDDPEYQDDPEFNSFTTDLSDRLFSLTANISRLSSQVALLGTKRETDRVRERVQDLLEETSASFKDIGDGLKKVQAWHDLGVCPILSQRLSLPTHTTIACPKVHPRKVEPGVQGFFDRVSNPATNCPRKATRLCHCCPYSSRRVRFANSRAIATATTTAATTRTAAPGRSV